MSFSINLMFIKSSEPQRNAHSKPPPPSEFGENKQNVLKIYDILFFMARSRGGTGALGGGSLSIRARLAAPLVLRACGRGYAEFVLSIQSNVSYISGQAGQSSAEPRGPGHPTHTDTLLHFNPLNA